MIPKLYEKLFNLEAAPGYEQPVRKMMREEMEKYPQYDIKTDHLGSLFAVKKAKDPKAPTVMVAGHMDEIGFMVVEITKKGMLKVQNLGGINGEVFISQVMNVHTAEGIVHGVFGAIPPHMKQTQQTQIKDLLLDIGATSKEEVEAFGVALGDMVMYNNPLVYTKNKKRIISKAIDNRFGCGLALEAIEHFAEIELPFHLVVGATVQEEVGLRGAETAVNLFEPDVFIALDASPVDDFYAPEPIAQLREGFLLRMYDPRNVMNHGLLKYFVKVAKAHGIKHQYFTSQGGTDAAKALDMQEGILATTIGLPTRYIHSTAAMMDEEDLASARNMLFAVLKDLTPEKIQKLQKDEEV